MTTEQTLTPAEELRAAASKIRESAEAATAGPWIVGERVAGYSGDYERSRFPIVSLVEGRDEDDQPISETVDIASVDYWHGAFHFPHADAKNTATHIALWHPGVAELVAKVFDNVARSADFTQGPNGSQPPMTAAALDLARAINGGAA